MFKNYNLLIKHPFSKDFNENFLKKVSVAKKNYNNK
jgi:hypothetical protein